MQAAKSFARCNTQVILWQTGSPRDDELMAEGAASGILFSRVRSGRFPICGRKNARFVEGTVTFGQILLNFAPSGSPLPEATSPWNRSLPIGDSGELHV